ncbi:TetR/AcrR family transcriptional regulator C-terminal domain-containing protein [Leucobacter sp. CSA2]|uniref:TetR/AcrR family transcriptional regulator C-terminal domain-containing protein n=1 Tax=Leucobacter edaphi TaxID=2796472 RepID=A0A934UX85_9MICO|nr:TetR/AcrR family transcriptional regulator C-terminal domain-containing protein [Leucobacter edaphi]MBK0421053.1 TetR/AcrR family transcriptional regulator C-terminal domain-containing protein [Leucobacter edaphi]
MKSKEKPSCPRKQRLTPARIVEAAARVADRGGLQLVSMRTVARELGVEAMSLYYHVKNKEALLDGLASWVARQFYLPDPAGNWREEMQRSAISRRNVLAAHPWGLGMIESRGIADLTVPRHHDAVLGTLYTAFDVRMAAHAFAILDAYIYGFVLTEVNLPFAPDSGHENEMAASLDLSGLPHLGRMVGELMTTGEYSYAAEFEIGLGLILDGLERLAATPRP